MRARPAHWLSPRFSPRRAVENDDVAWALRVMLFSSLYLACESELVSGGYPKRKIRDSYAFSKGNWHQACQRLNVLEFLKFLELLYKTAAIFPVATVLRRGMFLRGGPPPRRSIEALRFELRMELAKFSAHLGLRRGRLKRPPRRRSSPSRHPSLRSRKNSTVQTVL